MRQFPKLRLVILFLASSINIYATIMKEASITRMTKDSDLVIIGKVESVDCRWVEGGKMIHTFVTISIEKVIKGVNGIKSVVVEVSGGTIDNLTAMTMGEAKFHQGEAVLLFLVKNKIPTVTTYFVVALCQGKFRILSKDNDNRNLLERNLEGITIIEKKANVIPKYLDELIDEIKKNI